MEQRLADLMNTPLIRALVDHVSASLYLVGGSVRDLFLGRDLHDLDVVVLGDLEDAAQKTASALGSRPIPMGRDPFQIYRIPHRDLFIDLCPPVGADMAADLARRDLTINAMAVKLEKGPGPFRILDPFDGQSDLDHRMVRFISEANVLADPLRLLRLFRFMAVLDFKPDTGSLEWVRKHAALIANPAGERVREELLSMLSASKAHGALVSMLDHGLLETLIPEISPMKDCGQGVHHHHLDVLGHTLLAVECLEKILGTPEEIWPQQAADVRDYAGKDHHPALLKLALLLHDTGKPETRDEGDDGLIRFHGHESVSTDMARQVAKRLKLSTAETDLVGFFVRNHMKMFHLFDAHLSGHLTHRGIFRLGRLAGEDLVGLALHHLADAWATRGPARKKMGGFPAIRDFLSLLLDRIHEQRSNLKQAPKILSGGELMAALNLPPSPLIGRLLAAIQEAQALGGIANRDEALALARELAAEEGLKDI